METRLDRLNDTEWADADIARKFLGTYIIGTVIEPGVKQPLVEDSLIQITDQQSSPKRGELLFQCTYSPKPGVREHTWVPSKAIFVVKEKPDPCITNLKDSAILFNFSPKRQYSRGFNQENSNIYVGSGKNNTKEDFSLDFGTIRYNNKPITWVGAGYWIFETLDKVVTPIHCSWREALHDFENPKIKSRALSNHHWLIRVGETLHLYRKHALLGYFQKNQFYFTAEGSILDEELRDEIPDLKIASPAKRREPIPNARSGYWQSA